MSPISTAQIQDSATLVLSKFLGDGLEPWKWFSENAAFTSIYRFPRMACSIHKVFKDIIVMEQEPKAGKAPNGRAHPLAGGRSAVAGLVCIIAPLLETRPPTSGEAAIRRGAYHPRMGTPLRGCTFCWAVLLSHKIPYQSEQECTYSNRLFILLSNFAA
jgi:hypothetical protein